MKGWNKCMHWTSCRCPIHTQYTLDNHHLFAAERSSQSEGWRSCSCKGRGQAGKGHQGTLLISWWYVLSVITYGINEERVNNSMPILVNYYCDKRFTFCVKCVVDCIQNHRHQYQKGGFLEDKTNSLVWSSFQHFTADADSNHSACLIEEENNLT